MDLAIVIPYYKKKFFANTLQSLAEQTDQKFNVYVGDDAGPDSPGELIKYYKQFLNIRYFRFEKNLGAHSLPKQWRRCIEMVEEETWVMILGDDDTLDSNCISEFYKNLHEFESNKTNVVRFASTVIDEEGRQISKIFKHPEIEKVTCFFSRKAKGGTRSSLSEYVFRKKELMETGFRDFPLGWHTDDALLFEVSNFGKIYTLNDASVNFRHSSQNITQKRNNLSQKAYASWSFYKFLLERIDLFPEFDQPLVYEHYERAFLNNKRDPRAWAFTIKHYLVRSKYQQLMSLVSHIYSK